MRSRVGDSEAWGLPVSGLIADVEPQFSGDAAL